MGELLKYKKIIYIAVLILVGLVAYNYFFKPEINVDPVTSDVASSAGEPAAGKEILTLLGDLHLLVLDNSIFSSSAFKSLEDFSLPVKDEPKGRSNPFAPIGVNVAPVPEPLNDGETQTTPSTQGTFTEDFLEEDIVF